MNMVTWKSLGIILLGLGCIWMLGYGLLEFLAGGMSDNPSAGEAAGRDGLLLVGAGILCGIAAVCLAVWL
jgi:hypothetical protein